MIKPPRNVLDLPLEERAEMALKAAVEKLIVEHARLGRPIYIGEMVRLLRCLERNCESWLHQLRLTDEHRPESHRSLADITGAALAPFQLMTSMLEHDAKRKNNS